MCILHAQNDDEVTQWVVEEEADNVGEASYSSSQPSGSVIVGDIKE